MSNSTDPRPHRPARAARTLLLLVASVALASCSELRATDGGGGGDPTHLRGTVHAIGLVHERSDGAFQAELMTARIDGGNAAWLDGVYLPELGIEEGRHPFFGTSLGGVFETRSDRGGWVVSPGVTTRFFFRHNDEEGRESEFEAAIAAPTRQHTLEIAPTQLVLFAGEPVDIVLGGAADGVWLRVIRLGGAEEPTFSSFGLEGPGDVPLALERLRTGARDEARLPGSAFPAAGMYRIEAVHFGLVTREDAQALTENHGSHSLYGVGLMTSVVVELN
ncbi:MAG: hypothetical protein EA398_17290 [Deltaproteobacteria bacterium]|nr:MAG: hypothetical protein EA398_17290 [Deltaproteobacteria bacterium]